MAEIELIQGTCIGKANHYMSVPCSRNNPHGERRLIKDEKIRKYERTFFEQCKIYKNRNINVPFVLKCKVFFPSNAFDLDNSLKTILDCLQYCHAITNDNLCVSIVASKGIDKRNPRVEFMIEPIQQSLF